MPKSTKTEYTIEEMRVLSSALLSNMQADVTTILLINKPSEEKITFILKEAKIGRKLETYWLLCYQKKNNIYFFDPEGRFFEKFDSADFIRDNHLIFSQHQFNFYFCGSWFAYDEYKSTIEYAVTGDLCISLAQCIEKCTPDRNIITSVAQEHTTVTDRGWNTISKNHRLQNVNVSPAILTADLNTLYVSFKDKQVTASSVDRAFALNAIKESQRVLLSEPTNEQKPIASKSLGQQFAQFQKDLAAFQASRLQYHQQITEEIKAVGRLYSQLESIDSSSSEVRRPNTQTHRSDIEQSVSNRQAEGRSNLMSSSVAAHDNAQHIESGQEAGSSKTHDINPTINSTPLEKRTLASIHAMIIESRAEIQGALNLGTSHSKLCIYLFRGIYSTLRLSPRLLLQTDPRTLESHDPKAYHATLQLRPLRKIDSFSIREIYEAFCNTPSATQAAYYLNQYPITFDNYLNKYSYNGVRLSSEYFDNLKSIGSKAVQRMFQENNNYEKPLAENAQLTRLNIKSFWRKNATQNAHTADEAMIAKRPKMDDTPRKDGASETSADEDDDSSRYSASIL